MSKVKAFLPQSHTQTGQNSILGHKMKKFEFKHFGIRKSLTKLQEIFLKK